MTCRRCGGRTTGEPPPGTPAGAFGPRLSAMVGLLSGVCRLGKRPVRQLLADLFGLSISTGMICKLQRRAAALLTPAYDELCRCVRTQDVHLDETGWREDTKPAWLWTVAAPLVTIFQIARSRGRDVVEQLLGVAFPNVATCDRWTAYGHLKKVQWCWAHLRRDFQAMIDRGGPGRPTGAALLEHSDHLFHWWHHVRDGTLARATFRTYVGWLRSAVRDDLERGTACGCAKTAATFRVSLDVPSGRTITIADTAADGTATAGSDYQAVSGTLTFAPGETSKTITVPVIGDRLGEPNETFLVSLSQPTNAVIADGQGVGTVLDDEPRVSIGDVTKAGAARRRCSPSPSRCRPPTTRP